MVAKFLWFCVTFCASYFKVSLIIWRKSKSETVNISDAHTADEGGQEALQKPTALAKGGICVGGQMP